MLHILVYDLVIISMAVSWSVIRQTLCCAASVESIKVRQTDMR